MHKHFERYGDRSSQRNEERTSGQYQYKEGGYYRDLDRHSRVLDKKSGQPSNYDREHVSDYHYDKMNTYQNKKTIGTTTGVMMSGNHPQNFRDKSGNPKFSVNQPAFERIVKHQQQKAPNYSHGESSGGGGLERFFMKPKSSSKEFNMSTNSSSDPNDTHCAINTDFNTTSNKKENNKTPVVITSKLRADAPEFVPQCVTQKAIEMTNKYNIEQRTYNAPPEYPPIFITDAAVIKIKIKIELN